MVWFGDWVWSRTLAEVVGAATVVDRDDYDALCGGEVAAIEAEAEIDLASLARFAGGYALAGIAGEPGSVVLLREARRHDFRVAGFARDGLLYVGGAVGPRPGLVSLFHRMAERYLMAQDGPDPNAVLNGMTLASLRLAHRRAVSGALRRGLPVPPAVAAEFAAGSGLAASVVFMPNALDGGEPFLCRNHRLMRRLLATGGPEGRSGLARALAEFAEPTPDRYPAAPARRPDDPVPRDDRAWRMTRRQFLQGVPAAPPSPCARARFAAALAALPAEPVSPRGRDAVGGLALGFQASRPADALLFDPSDATPGGVLGLWGDGDVLVAPEADRPDADALRRALLAYGLRLRGGHHGLRSLTPETRGLLLDHHRAAVERCRRERVQVPRMVRRDYPDLPPW